MNQITRRDALKVGAGLGLGLTLPLSVNKAEANEVEEYSYTPDDYQQVMRKWFRTFAILAPITPLYNCENLPGSSLLNCTRQIAGYLNGCYDRGIVDYIDFEILYDCFNEKRPSSKILYPRIQPFGRRIVRWAWIYTNPDIACRLFSSFENPDTGEMAKDVLEVSPVSPYANFLPTAPYPLYAIQGNPGLIVHVDTNFRDDAILVVSDWFEARWMSLDGENHRVFSQLPLI